jgi:hypothetical protein
MQFHCILHLQSHNDDIQWPIGEEWTSLGMHVLKFQGCIKLINGTSIKILKP